MFRNVVLKSILWVLNEWLELHRFIGPAFCITGEPYSGINPIALSWAVSVCLKRLKPWFKGLLEGVCTLVPGTGVIPLISSTSFSWKATVVTFGVLPESQTIGFWEVFCGLGVGWHMEQMFCIQLFPWVSVQAQHTNRSRQRNIAFLNFEVRKPIKATFLL